MAAINAIKRHFPLSKVHGCFFHFSQNVWSHVQSVGLQSIYTSDVDFALQIRMMIALAFVPPENVVDAYEELMATDFFSDNGLPQYEQFATNIEMLVTYFQSTYLYAFDRKGIRKLPMFPVELWNVYENTLGGNTFIFRLILLINISNPRSFASRSTTDKQPY